MDFVDPARNGSGPPEIRREAGAFLFADRDDLERAARLPLCGEERLDSSQPRDDAEGSIEPTAATHGVDVRASHDALSFISPLGAAPESAHGITRRFQPSILEPAFHMFACLGPRVAIEGTVRPAIGESADGIQLVQSEFQDVSHRPQLIWLLVASADVPNPVSRSL